MHVSHWFGPEGGRAAYSTLVATVINQDPSVAPETMVDVQGMKPTYDWPVHIQTAGN